MTGNLEKTPCDSHGLLTRERSSELPVMIAMLKKDSRDMVGKKMIVRGKETPED
ncbi:MAG: hypothetical protein QHH04_09345 [Methanolinea sp.]|jgi:hypothetical protein|nr:hypothetical protein [Methanolinea sp.]